MFIKILPIDAAKHTHSHWADETLSLVDSQGRHLDDMPWNQNHSFVLMDDIGRLDRATRKDLKIVPSEENVTKALRYTKRWKENGRYIINCMAGVSRSPATAILVRIAHGWSPIDAFQDILTRREQASPNALILEIGGGLLGYGGLLSKLWRGYSSFDYPRNTFLRDINSQRKNPTWDERLFTTLGRSAILD